MQRNVDYAKSATVLSALVMVLILIFGAAGLVSLNSGFKALSEKFDSFDVDEAAIANAVLADIVIPEMPEYDTEKLDELWDNVYSPAVDALEGNATIVAIYQFLEDNDEFEDNGTYFFEGDEVYDIVTDGVDCDGDCVVEYIKEYDDREVEVINLGLDDLDDRLVELSTVIRVKVFTDEDNLDEYFFDKVSVDSTVTSDDEELEAEVTYSL